MVCVVGCWGVVGGVGVEGDWVVVCVGVVDVVVVVGCGGDDDGVVVVVCVVVVVVVCGVGVDGVCYG